MSRENYSHWNEDADMMWWLEEGRHESVPEFEDFEDFEYAYDDYEDFDEACDDDFAYDEPTFSGIGYDD